MIGKHPELAVMKAPFMASGMFRWSVITMIMAAAVALVYVFEIAPKMRNKQAVRARAALGQNPWTPGKPKGPEVRYDGVLDKARDGTPLGEEDEPYRTLVRHIGTAKPDAPKQPWVTVDYPLFARHASELRGETVRITAMVVHTTPLRLDRPEGGVEWIHRTYLVDLSGDEGYVVDSTEPPPLFQRHALWGADAVFLKMATYEGQSGAKTAPFFVARQVRLVHESMAKDAVNMGTLIMGAAVMAVFAAIYFSARVRTRTPKAPKDPEPVPLAKKL